MKIKSEFSFSDNGYEVNTFTTETDVNTLSEKAINYGLKIGAIEKAPQNKARKPAANKAKK